MSHAPHGITSTKAQPSSGPAASLRRARALPDTLAEIQPPPAPSQFRALATIDSRRKTVLERSALALGLAWGLTWSLAFEGTSPVMAGTLQYKAGPDLPVAEASSPASLPSSTRAVPDPTVPPGTDATASGSPTTKGTTPKAGGPKKNGPTPPKPEKPRANVLLLGTSPHLWDAWLGMAGPKETLTRDLRLWSYDCAPGEALDALADDLAHQLQTPAVASRLQGLPLYLVAHDRAGLVAKLFLSRMVRSRPGYPSPQQLSPKAWGLRVVYLDVPGADEGQRGQRWLNALQGESLETMLGGRNPLGSDASLDVQRAGEVDAVVPACEVRPEATLTQHDLEIRYELPALGLNKSFPTLGCARTAPLSVGRAPRLGLYELTARQLQDAHHPAWGFLPGPPRIQVRYHGWHDAVAQSRSAFELVFGELLAKTIPRPRTLPALASTVRANLYQQLTGRYPAQEETLLVLGQNPEQRLEELLRQSVEYAVRDSATRDAYVRALQRLGGAAVVGTAVGPLVDIEGGNSLLVTNPSDGSIGVLACSRGRGGEGQVWWVHGSMAEMWLASPVLFRKFGMPLGDPLTFRDAIRQEFEGGWLFEDPKTGRVDFSPRRKRT